MTKSEATIKAQYNAVKLSKLAKVVTAQDNLQQLLNEVLSLRSDDSEYPVIGKLINRELKVLEHTVKVAKIELANFTA